MENKTICENIEIIKKAYSFLERGHAFHNCTRRVQMSFLDGLFDDDYKKLDYKLKAIRQDFAKILIIMNSIDRTYLAYQKNEYAPSYYSPMAYQATDELGCFIEYLFAKYRVILEYIQQIIEICIPPKLDDLKRKEYEQLQKAHKKFNFLLKFIAENDKTKSNLLNMEWFQQLRVERDFIIHDGATCLVFGNKEDLLFKVMTTDAMDKEDDENVSDIFFSNKEGLIYYSRYWGLHISKLIVFCETIFDLLLTDSKMNDDAKFWFEQIQAQSGFVDNDGTKLTEKQDVLEYLLKSIIEN